MQRLWVIFFVFAFISNARSQEEKCVWISELNVPVIMDSLTLVPSSLRTPSRYVTLAYSPDSGELTVQTERYIDSVQVCYQVFPFAFNKVYQRRVLSDSSGNVPDTIVNELPMFRREEIFSSQSINKSGTISRGISFGNNQDVFVNSTLNLNLDGKLTDDLNIRASITDQNIPFQPEGNTQQLQDFDNVFVELYNDNFSLLAGDIVLRQQPSHFLRYYKNVQGGRAQVSYRVGGSEAQSSMGISVAKGQFESTQITPREGVTGPYLIPGPSGQPYVIILANSERVYLDGKLLERGFNRDYTIDYNQAQITFTNRILITEFTRIRIDYEYSDQNYSRSILAGSHAQTIGKFDLLAQFYREGDNRNKPLFGDLSTEEKIHLSEIGDDLGRAVTSGADSVAFTVDQVLYAKRDTTAGGRSLRIFEYSTDPKEAFFRVSFTEVGANKGDYILKSITANGRIYAWVAPENGIPQGDYLPIVRLPVPNKRQMFTIGGTLNAGEYEKVTVETAISTHDVNLYSDLDNTNDQGVAIRSSFESSGRNVGFLKDYTWQSNLSFEYDTRFFSGIDRFRQIEFNRDWNMDPAKDSVNAEEKIVQAGVGIIRDQDARISYQATYRNRHRIVDGFQHELIAMQYWRRWYFRGRLYHMNNDTENNQARWNQASADISRRGKKLVPGYLFELDRDHWKLNGADTSVMYFTSHTLYLRHGDESKWQFDLRYSYREDERPDEGIIDQYSRSHTSRFQLGRAFKNHRLNAIFTYRLQELQRQPRDMESISSRVEWQGSWFRNHLRAEITYAVSNSQELRREFVYVRVPAGEGTHTWRDMNGDNVQELDEFFLAINPDERNFAKIFVPTNEFVTAFQNLFMTQVRLDFPAEWREQGGLKALASRISNNTSWTSDKKIDSEKLSDKLFAFARDVDDVLAERNVLRSTTFFNRSSSVYGMEFAFLEARRRQLLTSGYEGLNDRTYSVTFRVNPVRQFNLRLTGTNGDMESFSDFLPDRNYSLISYRVNPQASWQPGTNFRLTLQYGYESRRSPEAEGLQSYALSNEFQCDIRYSRTISSVFNANVRFISIDFQGNENTPLGYDLLNALQPGQNITWNINWQQRITNGLQLSLRYDGRASENSRLIHTGRVQVSALF